MVAEFEKFVVSSFGQVRKGAKEVVEAGFAVKVADRKVVITAPNFTYETTLSKVKESKVKATVIAAQFAEVKQREVDLKATVAAPRKRGPKGPRSAGSDYALLEEALKTDFADRETLTRKELVLHMSNKTGRLFSLQPIWCEDVVTKKHGTKPALIPKTGKWGEYRNSQFVAK